MRTISSLLTGVMFAFLSLCVVPAQAGDPAAMQAFNQAITDFQNKDFEQAISGFRQAESMGLEVPALHQNLGASYYNLGQYGQAATEFSKLTEYPAMAALGYYNLGLVSKAQHHTREAEKWFRKVLETTQSDKLRRLAERQLGQKSSRHRPLSTGSNKWFSMVFASVGYDDNLTLENDTLINKTAKSGMVSKLFAYTRGPLMGTTSDGLLFKGSAFSKLNSGQSQINIGDYRVGLFYDTPLAGWDNEFGVALNHTTLGGNSFQDKVGVSWQGDHRFSRQFKLDLRAQYRNVNAASKYRQLNGSEEKFRIGGKWNGQANQFKLYYELTLNSRDDKRGTDVTTGLPFFFSASPTRHRIKGLYEIDVTERTSLEASAEYRLSSYNDDNIEILNTTPATNQTIGREDTRWIATLGLNYDYSRSTKLSLEYEYGNNDSNIDRFTYNHNVLMGRVRYIF
ncbi:MAG: hypothetical protein D6698_11875 [Gammaproteobacteria bacterium]|nr:MAG: hypothetical protein D6698_11875 [Gammaproteobacteria bacterium]